MSSTGTRKSRKPIESSDQVFIFSEGSPTFARRSQEASSSALQASGRCLAENLDLSESTVDTLPQLMDDVALTEKETFPPLDFIGTCSTERNSLEVGNEQNQSTNVANKELATENEFIAEISEQAKTEDLLVSESKKQSQANSPPQPKLRRKSSSRVVKVTSLPKVNCQEKIILCIDHSESMFQSKFQTQTANQTSVFKTLSSALKQFVRTKLVLNKKHQFSLVMMNDDAQLITDFSQDCEELLFMLKDIADSHTETMRLPVNNDDKVFDLSKLFDVVKQQCCLPRASPKHHGKTPPPHVVRIIFVYGRSDTRPCFLSGQKNYTSLNTNPYFFIDCVYIHEPAEANNMVEAIFSEICSLDVRGTSHIYEVDTNSNMACLYSIFAKLLAHPLQRPMQEESPICYNLELE